MHKNQDCSFKEDLNTSYYLCTVYVTSKELYARKAKRYDVSKPASRLGKRCVSSSYYLVVVYSRQNTKQAKADSRPPHARTY